MLREMTVRSASQKPLLAVACPACGGADLAIIDRVRTELQHRLYAATDEAGRHRLDAALSSGPRTYTMQRCGGCALEFASPLFSPPEAWYAALYEALDLYPTRRWEYDVVESGLDKAAVLLDYGCGSGHFLGSARQRVRRAIGVDFAAGSLEEAKARGAEVHRIGPGGPPPLLNETVDHVTAFHVLEHLAEPAALFDFARRVGGPNTRLWIAVPSDQRASRRYREFDALDAPPHHLTRWSRAALTQLGHRTGWRLAHFAYEPLPWSTRVWEATRRTNSYHRLDSVWPPLRRGLRRLLALGVSVSVNRHLSGASAFSMLAQFTPLIRTP